MHSSYSAVTVTDIQTIPVAHSMTFPSQYETQTKSEAPEVCLTTKIVNFFKKLLTRHIRLNLDNKEKCKNLIKPPKKQDFM